MSSNRLKLIEKDPLICMLLRHSLNAGDTLNILARLDRMNDIKSKTNITSELYEIFMERILSEMENFRTTSLEDIITTSTNTFDPMRTSQISTYMTDSMMSSVSMDEFRDKKNKVAEFKDEIMEMGNEILLMACNESLNIVENEKEEEHEKLLFDKLKSITTLILPFDQIILKTISQMLNSKLLIADSLVIEVYKEEFQLLAHLRNLREVYLLEASDLMFDFYTTLFHDVRK